MSTFPYWIDNDHNIWTKVNILANETITLYVKQTPGHSSNGDAVFEFFDDFNGNSLDTAKWNVTGSDYTVNNSVLTLNIDHVSPGPTLKSVNTWTFGRYLVEVYVTSHTNYVRFSFGFENNYYRYDDSTGFSSTYYGLCIDGQKVSEWGYDVPSSGLIGKVSLAVAGKTILDDPSNNTPKEWSEYSTNLGAIYLTSWSVSDISIDKVIVKKYSDQEPLITTEQVSNGIWKITVTNPNNTDLTDFQIKIPGNNIVSSSNDSLLITGETNNIPYTLSLTNTGSTTSLVNEVPQVTFRRRLLLYLNQEIGNSAINVKLYIPPAIETFWENRGKHLLLTDSNDNILQFAVTSESINELYGIVYNLSNYSVTDVFYLYFDDALERNTSNLVPEVTEPDTGNNIELKPKNVGQGSIVNFDFTSFDVFESDNLSIYYDNQLLTYMYDTEESKVYVKFPYMLTAPKITLYIYPESSEDLGVLDTIIYNGIISSMQIETLNTLNYGDKFTINGRSYIVIQKFIEDTPKIGVFNIEDVPDDIVNYGAYNRVYRTILHLTSQYELNELISMLQNEYVLIEWDDDIFYAVPLQHSNQMILSGHKKAYRVNIAFRRLFSRRV